MSQPPPAPFLNLTLKLLLHGELPGKLKQGGKVEREKEREEFESRWPLLLSGDSPAHP